MFKSIVFAAVLAVAAPFASADSNQLSSDLRTGAALLEKAALSIEMCMSFRAEKDCNAIAPAADEWARLATTLPIGDLVAGEYSDDRAVTSAWNQVIAADNLFRSGAARFQAWLRANQ